MYRWANCLVSPFIWTFPRAPTIIYSRIPSPNNILETHVCAQVTSIQTEYCPSNTKWLVMRQVIDWRTNKYCFGQKNERLSLREIGLNSIRPWTQSGAKLNSNMSWNATHQKLAIHFWTFFMWHYCLFGLAFAIRICHWPRCWCVVQHCSYQRECTQRNTIRDTLCVCVLAIKSEFRLV